MNDLSERLYKPPTNLIVLMNDSINHQQNLLLLWIISVNDSINRQQIYSIVR